MCSVAAANVLMFWENCNVALRGLLQHYLSFFMFRFRQNVVPMIQWRIQTRCLGGSQTRGRQKVFTCLNTPASLR